MATTSFLPQEKLDMISRDARRMKREQAAAQSLAHLASETERNVQLFLNKARIAAETGLENVVLEISNYDVRWHVWGKLRNHGYRVDMKPGSWCIEMTFLPGDDSD